MEPHLLDGKTLGAFLIAEVPGGEDQYGAVEGIASWDGNSLTIINPEGDDPPFPIPQHTYDRIKPVDEKFRLIFKSAEYYVALIIKPIAEGTDLTRLKKTGHRWPPSNDA